MHANSTWLYMKCPLAPAMDLVRHSESWLEEKCNADMICWRAAVHNILYGIRHIYGEAREAMQTDSKAYVADEAKGA